MNFTAANNQIDTLIAKKSAESLAKTYFDKRHT
jgi:hypothetical protein